VIRSPEPGDIIWESLNVSVLEKLKNQLTFGLILFIFIILNVAIITAI